MQPNIVKTISARQPVLIWFLEHSKNILSWHCRFKHHLFSEFVLTLGGQGSKSRMFLIRPSLRAWKTSQLIYAKETQKPDSISSNSTENTP
jgi:hypothetical protein